MKREGGGSFASRIRSKRSLYCKCRFKFYVNYANYRFAERSSFFSAKNPVKNVTILELRKV